MYYCSETDPYLACALTNSGYLVRVFNIAIIHHAVARDLVHIFTLQ